MRLWDAFIAFTLPNMMVLCMNTNFEYEASWERPRYKHAMDSSKMKPYVYRDRFPRKVYYSEPSKGETLLKPQERFPRSNSLLQPRMIHFDEDLELPYVYEANSHGIQSRMKKRNELRRVARNNAEIQILDMDPLQLKEALILGLRSLAKRQATDYSGVLDDLSETSMYSDNIHEEHEPNYPSKSSLITDDKHKGIPKEASESKLKKRSETPLYTKENSGDKLIDGSEGSQDGLFNPSLYRNDKHDDKLIESSEILTAELDKTPVNSNEMALDKLLEYSEIHKGPNDIEFQIEPINKKDEEYVDGANDEHIVKVYPEKIELHSLESRNEAHPKKHVRVKNYQDSIDEPPMLKVKTLSEGRNLEISNFLTPDKNSINSIDSQKPFSTHKGSKIINISKGDYISEENRIAGDDSIIHESPEKFAHDEASSDTNKGRSESQELVDDFLSEEKKLENSKEDEKQKDKNITEIITDSPPELKNSDEDNQKDKNEGNSNKSKDQNNETKDKDKKDTKNSNESTESSSESVESAEEVKPVKRKPLPTCPEYMDVDFRVDIYKGVTCSSDDDCKEEGEYCCQAYSNLNRCWSTLSSEAMNVTPSV